MIVDLETFAALLDAGWPEAAALEGATDGALNAGECEE